MTPSEKTITCSSNLAGAALQLLRRDVRIGPQNVFGARQGRHRRQARAPRQAKISHDRLIREAERIFAGTQQNVAWLEVAMNHVMLMRKMNCCRDLGHDLRCQLDRHLPLLLEPFPQGRPIDEFQDDIRDRVLRARPIDFQNPWVIQGRRRFWLFDNLRLATASNIT